MIKREPSEVKMSETSCKIRIQSLKTKKTIADCMDYQDFTDYFTSINICSILPLKSSFHFLTNPINRINPGLVSFIKTPGKLVMQCLKEVIFSETQKIKQERLFFYCQLNVFTYDFPTTIESTNYLVSAAFNFKRNNIIIRNKNGPYVQIMWGNRGD